LITRVAWRIIEASARSRLPARRGELEVFLPFRYASWLLMLLVCAAPSETKDKAIPWSLQPVIRSEVPLGVTQSPNPIDAFMAATYKEKGLRSIGPADRRTLLRRLYLDLVGVPPTLAEQDAFLRDTSPNAYEKLVDRLLASDQHGVRYARHWLDVLRYADIDEGMTAAPGIHLWRDWMINALNADLPYDQFVRVQLTGFRTTERIEVTPLGARNRLEPRPDDLYALGFLARGHVGGDPRDPKVLSIAAAETVSTAFMGLTVGCAKCHDHMYDPISQRSFYALKALFDPLVLKKTTLGTPAEIFARGRILEEIENRRAALEASISQLVAPFKNKLYEERVVLLPPDVQLVIRKAELERTEPEQKIANDYFPVLRIDSGKIMEIMSSDLRQKYQKLLGQLRQVEGEKSAAAHPVFWTVETDVQRAARKNFILTSGDPDRPELNHEVTPGWPFGPEVVSAREGTLAAFANWLTAPANPLFARVAVNRLWQWHFGEGLHKLSNDFGNRGGMPEQPKLLDWLAAEFVNRKFSMKQMHRLIVTSETYKLASTSDYRLQESDPNNTYLWHFPLQRLEAEPIWDSILSAAGMLDMNVGGPSFNLDGTTGKAANASRPKTPGDKVTYRRAAYIVRGYSSQRNVVPQFLEAFDVDDGRASCPQRTQTVTAPQSLFMMNSAIVDRACNQFAERLKRESAENLPRAVELAYRITLARQPSAKELEHALVYLDRDPSRLRNLAWLLFNLDEFIYVR
jgi:Protein of unknown function (DUF1553)/Protein of unknown function (DUF1549)